MEHDNYLDIYIPNMFSRGSFLAKLINQLFCCNSPNNLSAACIQTINCIKSQSIFNNEKFLPVYENFENNSFLFDFWRLNLKNNFE